MTSIARGAIVEPNYEYRYEEWREGLWEPIWVDTVNNEFHRVHEGRSCGAGIDSWEELNGMGGISVRRINSGFVVGKPDGGPAEYYDLPQDRPMNTLNDILEWKGETQWLGDSFHLANITKAGWRWGIKDGTTKEYDARKFIYSGARLLMKYAGVKELRKTLQKMLDDPQFQEKE